MASHQSERNNVEERGLLRSSSFEIEDAEFGKQSHKRTTRSDEDWLDARRVWKKFPAWSRLRKACVGLTAALIVVSIILLLVILGYDEAVYRAQKHKIDKATTSKLNEDSVAKTLRPAEGTPIPLMAALSGASQPSAPTNPTQPSPPSRKFEKPQGFKIIGLIFYGRASTVTILDCYLKKNLVSNGGFLDEVHWAVNTENQEDLQFLDKLVETTDSYKKITIPAFGYNNIWEHAVEPEHMYIKIDDDIVTFSS